ncbi:DUF2397 family protein [Nonomuraea angiospora]|uniref:DUF2397 family protein n=1 Tax=Nonomuraea angiospora TaxID=46172 RepID=UPI003428AE11
MEGWPSQARLLRPAAITAIKQLIDAVGLLNERRSGRSDRSADFRALSRWDAEELAAVAFALNTRPRKTLGWKTPAEAFSEHLNLLLSSSVATTD